MKPTFTLLIALAACLACQTADAQINGPAAYRGYAVRYGNNGTPAIYHHASTYEEGVQRGAADLVRAWGDFAYNRSLAMINYEEARGRYIENRVDATKAYFDMRAINRQARAEEAGPRPTREDAERYARNRVPNRLATHELDPTLGNVNWPALLQSDAFESERRQIAELMQQRAKTAGDVNSPINQQIRQLTDQMESKLKASIASVTPSDYIAGKNFLKSLEYETFQAVPIQGLAIR